jgi:hypothetical protein
MLIEPENKTRWYNNFYSGQEWYVMMNAFKVDDRERSTLNGSVLITNYTAKAIFSSTVRYLQFPGSIYQSLITALLKDKLNSTISGAP